MMSNKTLKVSAALAAPVVISACMLEVSGLAGAGGAKDTESSGIASTGSFGGGGAGGEAESTASSAASSGASSTGGGGMEGGCTSPEDSAILVKQGDVLKEAQQCGGQCFANPNRVQCATDCMIDKAKFSAACGACWGKLVDCASAQCTIQCNPPNSQPCNDCTAMKCEPAYHTCAGL